MAVDINSKQQPLIQSVSRAIAILNCFKGGVELGLTEVSHMVNLHKSTTAGIVNTLKAEGFLDQNLKTGKLRFGIGLFSLAVNARSGLDELCEPYLTKLLEITGETVNLAVPSNTSIVYIAKKESAHSIRISTGVGTPLPSYCTANGKAILATYDRDKAISLIDKIDFFRFTKNTIVSREALLKELDTIAQEGIAYDNEEYELGVICISAPLYIKQGNPVGAVSVSGPLRRMDEKARRNIANTLREVTGQICGELTKLA
jgi:DNA-binding IclR family transcriptional regulator